MATHSDPPVPVLTSEFSALELWLDPRTGLPSEITNDRHKVTLRCSFSLLTEGREITPPYGGIAYEDTVTVGISDDSPLEIATDQDVDCRTWRVRRTVGDWSVVAEYKFRAEFPRLTMNVEVRAPDDRTAILRNTFTSIEVHAPNPQDWVVHAPGNQLKPDLVLKDMSHTVAISPPAGLRGSCGLVALEHTTSINSLVMWPFAESEISDVSISPTDTGLRLSLQSDLAGVLSPATSLSTGPLHLDLIGVPWGEVLAAIPGWLSRLGVTSPTDVPEWVATAAIYEVQIGFSVFSGWRYEPYPTATDLFDDLDRIQASGFDTIQIMPRHPFPSYNVYEYNDVDTSWGDADELRRVIQECHRRGMHVLLDILLHGVVDQEVVKKTADAVRAGPYFARVSEESAPLWSADDDDRRVSWSRHILDFEPYWQAGSAPRHHLVDEHPEWFCRDSSGEIVGIYTKSFDTSHPGWQRYFIDSCLALVHDLDIDGFRLDAPTYNYFPNWSPRTAAHASTAMMGCIPLFAHLRRELRALKPDAVMYTEPSGALWRMNMDIAYNYDEQWLFSAVLDRASNEKEQERLTAAELGTWLDERNATLPAGSLTVHHIDSHDTFWWPLPGKKWFRELHDLVSARALMAVFALSGGPFMMFVGAEVGLEEDVHRVLRLRRLYPALADGTSDYHHFSTDNPDIYQVVRQGADGETLVLVNLTGEAAEISGTLHGRAPSVGELVDVYGEIPIATDVVGPGVSVRLSLPIGGVAVVPLQRN